MSASLEGRAASNAAEIDGLVRLGYSAREARFLMLAALQSGYFLRRQYARFVGQRAGGTVAALLEKAFARNHLHVSTVGRTRIYHLASRAFYAALGGGDNRHRRERPLPAIQNKLMGLDYVLGHRNDRFLLTEQEKVEHFTQGHDISLTQLPAARYADVSGGQSTTRYFVEKYPVFLRPDAGKGIGVIAGFCFVDEGLTTTSRFETFLGHHRALLRVLPAFEVVYVADSPRLFEAAKRLFDREFVVQSGLDFTPDWSALDPVRESYFTTRFLFESARYESFDRARLIEFRAQQAKFSSQEDEHHYLRWKRGRGPDSPCEIVSPNPNTSSPVKRFSTCLLEHRYELFGNVQAF